MKAIETVYRGYRMRSRLEARWAAFFDGLGWRWAYEPYDLDGWIPDFLIFGERPLLVEVKPAICRGDLNACLEPAHLRQQKPEPLLVGIDPLLDSDGCAGLLGESAEFWDGANFARGIWCRCRECGNPAVFHEEQSYACRPCGHYDGDNLMGDLPKSEISEAWAVACNVVQWGRNAMPITLSKIFLRADRDAKEIESIPF
jgi:hypothetical protein